MAALTIKQRHMQTKRCWFCGKYTGDFEPCYACEANRSELPYTYSNMSYARAYGVKKSEMIDFTKQHVPSPG